MWGSSGLRISTGQCGVELRRWPRGQVGSGINGGEQMLGKQFTCGGGSRGNFGVVVAETEGSGLGVDPGPDAELLRGSGRARRRRCSVAAAARGCGATDRGEAAL